jgi:hypothetical protein
MGLQQQPGEIGVGHPWKNLAPLASGSNGLRQKRFYETILSPVVGTLKMLPEKRFGLGRMGTVRTCITAMSDARIPRPMWLTPRS